MIERVYKAHICNTSIRMEELVVTQEHKKQLTTQGGGKIDKARIPYMDGAGNSYA